MNLTNFNSYFEVLVGLNLGYAVFEHFRQQLSERVFRVNSNPRLNELLSRLDVQIAEAPEDGDLLIRLKDIRSDVAQEETNLKGIELNERYFFEILKPISYLLSLLCITYLLIAGFQDSFKDKEPIFSNFLFTLTVLVAVFVFSIFFSSLSRRIIYNKVNLKVGQILKVYIFFVLLAYFCVAKHFVRIENFWTSFIITIIPLSSFLFLIWRNVRKVEKYSQRNWWDSTKAFCHLLWLYRVNAFKYCSFLVLGSLPVIGFIYFPKFVVIKYLIVLTTPVFLYVFTAIRVFLHNHKFDKKYRKKEEYLTTGLEMILRDVERDLEN